MAPTAHLKRLAVAGRSLLIRPHQDVRLAIVVWGVLAVVSLTVAFVVAGRPAGSDAFFEVRGWLTLWRSGVNVYERAGLFVDYPPNALVFLSPLLLFPSIDGALWFAAVNIAACIAAAWLIVSLTSGYAGVSLTRIERLATC